MYEEMQPVLDYLYNNGAINFSILNEENAVIEVNKNYLTHYGFEELSGYNYIVPIDKKEEFLSTNPENYENTFYYAQVIEVFNLTSSSQEYILNPVFIINESQNTSFYLPNNKTKSEYQDIINQLYRDSTEWEGLNLYDIDDIKNSILNTIIKLIDDIFLTLILPLLMSIYLTINIIYLYFHKNRKLILIKRLNGIKIHTILLSNFVIMNLIIVIILNFAEKMNIHTFVSLTILNLIFYAIYKVIEKQTRRIND